MGETLKWSDILSDWVIEVGGNKYSQQRHRDVLWS